MTFVRIVLLLVGLVITTTVSADAMVQFEKRSADSQLLTDITFLVDDSGTLEYADVATMREQFRPIDSKIPNFGFTDSAYWFHTQVKSFRNGTHQHYFEIDYPLLDNITIYENNNNGTVRIHQAGDHVNLKDKNLLTQDLLFSMLLDHDTYTDLYIRVETNSVMQVPMRLWVPESYMHNSKVKNFLLGVYYGTLAALIAYNLILIFWARNPICVHYSSYLIVYCLFQLSHNGIASKYFWPNSIWLADRGTIIFLCLAAVFASLFSLMLLHLDEQSKFLHKTSKAITNFFIVMLPLLMIGNYQLMAQLLIAGVVFASLFYLYAGIRSLSAPFPVPAAKLYVIAWSVSLTGTLLTLFNLQGFVPTNFFTEYSIQIGSTIEAVLLSFALSHRHKTLRVESMRIQTEVNEKFEERVEQRTQELITVVDELSVANAKLEGMNNTDSLTGVSSRAFFDSYAESVWENTANTPESLSIVMIDVDNFKTINDNYGHLIGDEVLVAIAHAVKDSLARTADQVARYGGEEFVVILPGTGTAGALTVAERIRQSVEAINTSQFGLGDSVTISLGISVETPRSGTVTLRDSIEQADAALYQAKRNGKNRSEVYEHEIQVKESFIDRQLTGADGSR